MANPTPNDILMQLDILLKPVLVPIYADILYPYRTLPNTVNRYVSLSYIGGLPLPYVTVEKTAYYDFAAVLVVKFDTNDELKTAEETKNLMEYHIQQTLLKSKDTPHWLLIEFTRPSIHPPAPPELPKTRVAEVYFRVKLK